MEDIDGLIICLYEKDRKSLCQISNITNIPVSTVRRRLIKNNVKMRTKKEAISIYDTWGFARSKKKKPPITEAHKDAMKRGWKNKIGKEINKTRINKNGYVEYCSRANPNFARAEHTIKKEERIGRKLFDDEVVHHVDGDKTNNNINNLALMTRSAHSRLHRREEKLTKKRKK